MLIKVVFVIFMIIVVGVNACPLTERPCKTPNGTNGNCIQLKHCPYIRDLGAADETPEKIELMEKSVCGLDLDKSRLFCCDNNGIQFSNSNGIDRNCSISASSGAKAPINNDQLTESKIVNCETPNGEKAQCISVHQCPIIFNTISQNRTDDQQLRFLKDSVCDYNNGAPLVCCGSTINFKVDDNIESKLKFKQNPLIPAESCGLQSTEAEERTIPIIRQRFGADTKNFALPNRIFGGTNSELTEFPWLALLAFEMAHGKTVFACGGSLISSRYVLTAAHCVAGQTNLDLSRNLSGVRLGEWDHSNKGRDCITTDGRTACNEGELDVGVESVHPHPGYVASSKNKQHDIALIRLDGNVKFTKYISPVCLPNVDDYVSPRERLTIAGWGIISYSEETTIKQKVDIPVATRAQCSVMFEKLLNISRVGIGQFCAGGESGKDACVGDSGAPLMRKFYSNTNSRDQWYVAGIVSFGRGCGLENDYGIYTKVSEYLGWIHSTIEP